MKVKGKMMKLILNVYELLKVKKATGMLIFLIAVFQILSCSSPEKTNSQSSMSENKPISSTSESPNSESKQKYIAEEHIAEEWRNKYHTTADKLEHNRRLWQKSKILNYDFVVWKSQGGTTNLWNRSPVVIKIREGEKTSIEVESKSDNSYMARTDGFEDFDTISKLFNFMRQELDDGKIIEAKYDNKFGYPKEVFVIFSFNSHGQLGIEISKFEIIK